MTSIFKGQKMEMHFVFHEDAGHGWLQVSKSDVKRLGLQDKISCCSYIKGSYVYLEEDCDAPKFVEAYKAFCKEHLDASEVNIIFDEVYDGDDSPIRYYAMYEGSKL